MKKILITGASGSGGSYLSEYILQHRKKYFVYGIYRNKKKLSSINCFFLKKNKRFKYVYCDLSKQNQIEKTLNQIKPDYIFHLASNADVNKSFYTPKKIILDNNLCTLNLLEAMRLTNCKAKIQICSTSEVYGNVPRKLQPISEEVSIKPANPYAISKVFQDYLSQVYYKVYKLNVVITRMFTYLNARRTNLFASSFAHQLIKMKYKKKPKALLHGNLKSKRVILDIRDAMNAYLLSMEKGKVGEIYNIGGGHVATIGQVLDELIKNFDFDVKKIRSSKLLRPSDIDIQLPDSKKFKKTTGWKIKYNFKEGIKYLLKETEIVFFYNSKKKNKRK